MNALACPKVGIFDLPESTRIDCTLYDLIAALIGEAGSGEDALVVSAVLDLMGSGKVEWKNKPLGSKVNQAVQKSSPNNNLIMLPGNLHE